MKTYTATREIIIDGIPFETHVAFTVAPGRPQSYGQPAEHPTADIKAMSVNTEDGWVDAAKLYDLLADEIEEEWLVDEAHRQDVERRDATADQADHLRRECA